MDKELGTRICGLAIALLVVAVTSGCASLEQPHMDEPYGAPPQPPVEDGSSAFATVLVSLAEWMLTPSAAEKPARHTKRYRESKPIVVVVRAPPSVQKRRHVEHAHSKPVQRAFRKKK